MPLIIQKQANSKLAASSSSHQKPLRKSADVILLLSNHEQQQVEWQYTDEDGVHTMSNHNDDIVLANTMLMCSRGLTEECCTCDCKTLGQRQGIYLGRVTTCHYQKIASFNVHGHTPTNRAINHSPLWIK